MSDPKLWEELPKLGHPKDHFCLYLNELRKQDSDVLYEVLDEFVYLRDSAKRYKLSHSQTRLTIYVEFLNEALQSESSQGIAEAIQSYQLKMPDMIILTFYLEELEDAQLLKVSKED